MLSYFDDNAKLTLQVKQKAVVFYVTHEPENQRKEHLLEIWIQQDPFKKKHKETSVAEFKISQNKGYKSVDFFFILLILIFAFVIL